MAAKAGASFGDFFYFVIFLGGVLLSVVVSFDPVNLCCCSWLFWGFGVSTALPFSLFMLACQRSYGG